MRNMQDTPKIKKLRLARHMTQRELSLRSDVPIRTIQKYDNRERDINSASAITVYNLSIALGCTMEDLLEI